MNRNIRGFVTYAVLAAIFIFLVFGLKDSFDGRTQITYREFEQMLEQEEVAGVVIT